MAKKKKKGSYDLIRKLIETEGSRLHFIGIGGVSMYSLARLSVSSSLFVSGSDRERNERIDSLESLGVKIHIGHNGDNINGADLVIYSHAISEDNPELVCARQRNVPTVSRAEFLGAVMTEYKLRIGVSGTHGKSTTVAMLDTVFAYARKNHTTLSGASLVTGEPYRLGSAELFLFEGCEYKDSFLKFSPHYLVALNLEYDHPDYFSGISQLKESFAKAFMHSDEVILNYDDPELLSVGKSLSSKKRIVTFGKSERADYKYSIIGFDPHGYRFTISHNGECIGSFEIGIMGAFNVTNAVAAAVTAIRMGIEPHDIAAALASFRGIGARLQLVGIRGGREVYRDYAHHPTEIRSTLNTLKMHLCDSVTVVFKPHTYSRTKAFFDDFRNALSIADHVVLTEVYAAREAPIPGISSARLAEEIGSKAIYCEDDEVTNTIDLSTHGVIVIMGAGNMEKITESII